MKNILLLVNLLITAFVLKAQDSTIILSKYEQYCTTGGRLIKTSTMTIGEVRTASIEVLKTTDVKNGDSISVVRISPARGGVKPLIANNNLYIDKEELPDIISVLQYYSAEIKNENSKAFLYSYVTRNDVRITCNYTEGVFSNSWLQVAKIYQYLRTPVRELFTFNKKDIDSIVLLLKTAQERL